MPYKIKIGEECLYKLGLQEKYTEVKILTIEKDYAMYDEDNILVVDNKNKRFWVSEHELTKKEDEQCQKTF